MRRLKALALVLILLVGTKDARSDVVSDATGFAAKLSPINIALKGLIGEAAEAGDAVLQKQLEHLQSIIQMAIWQLNEVAKQRIDQLDERSRQQIAELNKLVQSDLLQLDSIVGKHLSNLDASMKQRINQFNFGLANTLASIRWLPTVPLLQLDGNAITTFKQKGKSTSIFIGGSSFTKFGEKPKAYLSGASVKSTSWFSASNEIAVEVPNASMGLIEIAIPNEVIPDQYAPQTFSLKLQIRDGSSYLGLRSTYNEQSVRLNICGRLPRLSAAVQVWASGMVWVRESRPWKDLLHASTPNGNTNQHDQLCLPDSPPVGWDYDLSAPDQGITYGGENHNAYGRINRYGPGNRCIEAYADGREGNSHQNIQDLRMKLIKLVDAYECNPKWRSEPFQLPYGRLFQKDVANEKRSSSAGACEDARARAIPVTHVRVELLDDAKKVLESRDLVEGAEVTSLAGSIRMKLNANGIVDFNTDPQCVWTITPAGN